VKQTLFHVLVHCNHTMDQGRMTWRHGSVLKHIAACLNSALKRLGTVVVVVVAERDISGVNMAIWHHRVMEGLPL
jgi:predicted metal-dependent HD superfamily phosphohydrolase